MKSKIAQVCLLSCLVSTVPALRAATVNQVLISPGSTIDWNNTTMWAGGATVVNTNDYQTVAGPTSAGVGFTAGGTAWNIFGFVRDSVPNVNTVFNGGSLIINTDTRLLMKSASAGAGSTSSANIVLNGGFIQAAPNNGGTVTLNGTINLAAPLGAIGTNPSNAGGGTTLTLNINSTLTGAGTLQLVAAGDAGATRVSHINLTGNISAFTGTLYLSSSTSNNNVAVGSDFSITNSAPLAGLSLATTTTNFKFNLNSNITFASLTVGATTLGNGTYNFAALDAIAPGKFTNSGGSITVITAVPEPSMTAIGVAGLLVTLVVLRRRAIKS